MKGNACTGGPDNCYATVTTRAGARARALGKRRGVAIGVHIGVRQRASVTVEVPSNCLSHGPIPHPYTGPNPTVTVTSRPA